MPHRTDKDTVFVHVFESVDPKC